MIAYIDPGAGSFALQALVAAVAGAAYAFRGRWRRLRERFGPRRAPEPGAARGAADPHGEAAPRGDG